jgi:hypothetical protein
MVFDGTQIDNPSRLKFYFNGAQQTLGFNGTIPATTNSNDTPAMIGAGQSGGAPDYSWTGQIDDVRIYDRALTPNEVGDLYRMGQATIKR